MRKKIQASPSVGRLTQRRAQDDQLIQVANKKTGLSRWPKKQAYPGRFYLLFTLPCTGTGPTNKFFVLIFCVVFYSFWMKKLSWLIAVMILMSILWVYHTWWTIDLFMLMKSQSFVSGTEVYLEYGSGPKRCSIPILDIDRKFISYRANILLICLLQISVI